MKKLIVLRHGEAGFSNGLDFQRQLTQKGKSALEQLGKVISEKNISVDFMYCSPATRTRETAQIMGDFLEIHDQKYSMEIYDGHLESLIQLLEKTSNAVETCLLVGHNPTISLLVSHISDGDYVGLQPGMMAILELHVSDWAMVGHGTGSLVEILH